MDWLEQERQDGELKVELRRLKRRAKSHPYLLVLLTLATVIALVAYKETRQKSHKAYIVLRVTEGEIVKEANPLAGRKMDEYLRSVALSNTQLNNIVEQHNLYPVARAKGQQYAIEEIRDAMRIKIVNNYFAGGFYLSTSARSARVTIRFEDKDPDVAFAVASDLAEAMVANEYKRRQWVANEVKTLANRTLNAATKEFEELQQSIASTELILVAAKRANEIDKANKMEVVLSGQEKRSQQLATALSRLERNKARSALALAVDQAKLGLRFDVVDRRAPLAHERPPLPLTLAAALLLFLLILPITSVAIGAFDHRLDHQEDVERLGLTYLGTLSAPARSVQKSTF